MVSIDSSRLGSICMRLKPKLASFSNVGLNVWVYVILAFWSSPGEGADLSLATPKMAFVKDLFALYRRSNGLSKLRL